MSFLKFFIDHPLSHFLVLRRVDLHRGQGASSRSTCRPTSQFPKPEACSLSGLNLISDSADVEFVSASADKTRRESILHFNSQILASFVTIYDFVKLVSTWRK